MRKSQLTQDEILDAERAADARHQSRNQGFAKMHERDKAVQLMSNGAVMMWHVPKELDKQESSYTTDEGEVVDLIVYPPEIPEDSFGLRLDGKTYLFNTDEFRKWIRWA